MRKKDAKIHICYCARKVWIRIRNWALFRIKATISDPKHWEEHTFFLNLAYCIRITISLKDHFTLKDLGEQHLS
jgi:hypothetical protein